MTRETLLRSVEEYVTFENIAVLHCRIASKGTVSLENAHPFLIKRHGGLLVHNGTLSLKPLRPDGTDTEALANLFSMIRNLPTCLADKKFVEDMEELLYPSKVVTMTLHEGKPQVTIFNEEFGEVRGRLWASNATAFEDGRTRWRKERKNKGKNGITVVGEYGTYQYKDGKLYYNGQSCGPYLRDRSQDEQKSLVALPGGTTTGTTALVDTSDPPILEPQDGSPFDDDPVEGPPYFACMASSNVFEDAPTFYDVLGKVRDDPYEAAKALWYYRELMGG